MDIVLFMNLLTAMGSAKRQANALGTIVDILVNDLLLTTEQVWVSKIS